MSIGVDGERQDAFLKTDKPTIEVREGQWFVTAQQALAQSRARVEYVRELKGETPLGPVFICRALERATIMLGGLRHRQEMEEAIRQLEILGAPAIWIDGAYGRVTGAHPALSDAAVVATGAICGKDVEKVAKKTASMVSKLGCPAIEEGLESGQKAAIGELLRGGQPGVVGDDGVRPLETRSALLGLEEVAQMEPHQRRAVVIPGVVTEGIVEELLAIGRGRLYLSDPTVLQLDVAPWERLVEAWDPRVWRSVEVVGVSYNPTSVTGIAMEASAMEKALRARIDGVPIFDGMAPGLRLIGDGLADV